MSLIRNGGFERGNTDFWEVESGGSLEISNISPLYGTYCGKFTANTTSDPVVLSSDYIDVKPYQIVDMVLYLKSAASKSCILTMHYYDADYTLIGTDYGNWTAMDGTWVLLNNQFYIPSGTAYIRVGFTIHSPDVNDIFYIDGAGLEIISDTGSFSGIVELLPFESYTASGGTYSSAKTIQQYTTYFAELYCNFVSGTSPTLDVEVKEINWKGQSCHIADFSTVTTDGDYRIDLPHCWGNEMYVVYTIGGTDPEFDFGVVVIGKR